MGLTNYAKEMMGFKKMNPPEEISGDFFLLKIYSLDGVSISESDPAVGGRLNQFVTFALGNRINELSNLLCNDELTEDIAAWEKQYMASKPYLMTLTTHNVIHSGKVEWLMETDDKLCSYGAFTDVKELLRKLVAQYEVPAAVRAVAALSSEVQLVKANPKFKRFIGRQVGGRYIEDINFNGSATLSTSRWIPAKQAVAAIESGINRSAEMTERSARLAYASMEEADNLKSFLFGWMALEVFINQVYGLNSSTEFPIDKAPAHLIDRIRKLYKDKRRGLEIITFAQKLYFLASFKWSDLTIQDLELILSAKKIRDDFAHGNEITQAIFPTSETIAVLYKLLRAN